MVRFFSSDLRHLDLALRCHTPLYIVGCHYILTFLSLVQFGVGVMASPYCLQKSVEVWGYHVHR